MKTPQAAVDAYFRGDLILTDLFIQLGHCLAEMDAHDFVASLPKDLRAEMVRRVADFPNTAEGWSRMRVLAIAPRIAPVSKEQIENEQREEARLLRRGVELVRAGVANVGGGGVP